MDVVGKLTPVFHDPFADKTLGDIAVPHRASGGSVLSPDDDDESRLRKESLRRKMDRDEEMHREKLKRLKKAWKVVRDKDDKIVSLIPVDGD